jgi:methylmalonyl-CoA/ethylmalonyl-CoA epimerase
MDSWKMGHVGYVVKNMEGALKRFAKEGCSVLIPATDDPIQKVSCALLSMPGDCNIELVAPLDGQESPLTGRLARQGGLDHICFIVPDLAEAFSQEVERGSLPVCQPTFAITFNADIAFVHRRSGLVVELMAFRNTSNSQDI